MREKKIFKSVLKSGIDPFKEGRKNFLRPKEEIEKLAKERINICGGCDEFLDESVDLFKVNDKRTPEATEKYCGDCGCILSYKIRQNIDTCKKWQK